MLNKGIHIETWNENVEAVIEMLTDVDCLGIISMRQDRDTSIVSARTNFLGLFRIFKKTFNRPEFRVYWSF